MKAAGERFAVGFPLELRFTAGDDALLSPTAGRDSAFVAVHVFRGMPWEPYFRAVEQIADAHGGRPHWGKRHFQSAATLAPRYPAWEALDRKSTRLNSSHANISYAVFCLKKKKQTCILHPLSKRH